MTYRAPVKDMLFVMKELAGIDAVAQLPGHEDAGLDTANISKEELAHAIQKRVPNFYIHFSEIGEDPDKRNYIVSNQRLREAGFEAKRSLDDGIVELIKGYRLLGRAPRKNI